MRASYVLVLVPALVGTVLGLNAYFGPFDTTGVEGTPGALLALIGAVAVTLGTLLAMGSRPRSGWRSLLNVLMALGAVLTALAAWFLMQHALAVAMLLAFLGLVVTAFATARRPA